MLTQALSKLFTILLCTSVAACGGNNSRMSVAASSSLSAGGGTPTTPSGSPSGTITSWEVVDLTTPISQQIQGIDHAVSAINDAGEVVGTILVDPRRKWPHNKAFVYKNETVTDLGMLGGDDTQAQDINNAGQIVGTGTEISTGPVHAFLYRDGTMEDLFVRAKMLWAVDINNSGQIVGIGYGSSETHYHAMIYSNGTVTDIGTSLGANRYSRGRAINDKGQALLDSGRSTFLYSGGTITDLSTLPGCTYSEATALNDLGQVTGTCQISGSTAVHAFILTDGHLRDIGTLEGREARPAAINNSGQVVGWLYDPAKASASDPDRTHGFMYTGGKMTNLNALPAVVASGWKIQSALGINSVGQIFGRGLLNGQVRFYLLTPVRE